MTPAEWDRRYSRKGFAYGTEPNDFLREVAPRHLPAGARTLCLGEGEGRNAVFLASLGMACTAVDVSRVGLAKARKLAADRGVRISTVPEDLASYDPGVESWDVVVSIFCHLPPEVRARIHSASARALRPGGVFLLEAFSPRQRALGTDGPPDHDRLVTLRDLAEDFAGFEVIVSQEVEREVNEGTYHNGPGAVVQFLARRPVATALASAVGPAAREVPPAAAPEAAQAVGVVVPTEAAAAAVEVPAIAGEAAADAAAAGDMWGARRRYRAAVDELHAGGELPGGEGIVAEGTGAGEAEEAPPRDFLLAHAGQGVRLATETAAVQRKCRYCWVPEASCFCAKLPQLGDLAPKLRWALLQHPQEFLRCSSSGKLVADLLGGDFLVCGAEQHRARLEQLLSDPRTHLLLPSKESLSVAEAVERCGGLRPKEERGTGAAGGADGEAAMVLLVPDGSWEHVRAMREELPALPCVQLDDKAVGKYESALIDALKPGAGRGRLSTFEACALLLREAEALGAWGVQRGAAEAALEAMEPLVAAVRRELAAFAPPTGVEGPLRQQGWRRTADATTERWIAALQEAARAAPCPEGLKRCCVCGAVVSSPLRMQEHLEGRRHCFVVATLHLGAQGSPEPTAASATEVFERYSILPMSQCIAEPPDVALLKLMGDA